jgi:hypothetical protein
MMTSDAVVVADRALRRFVFAFDPAALGPATRRAWLDARDGLDALDAHLSTPAPIYTCAGCKMPFTVAANVAGLKLPARCPKCS